MEAKWYIQVNGMQQGPVDESTLTSMGLNPNSMVWCAGMNGWAPAGSIPELSAYITQSATGGPQYGSPVGTTQQPYPNQNPNNGYAPQGGYGMPNQQYNEYGNPYNQPQGNPQFGYMNPNQQTTDKSKIAAGILALLLGCLGIQYFYCGKVGGGFICIALTLVTCGIWDIISFIQGIMMLSMSQQEFERKYVLNDKTFPIF